MTAPQKEPAGSEREALIDLIEEHLTAVYHCTRVWSAWQFGTMTEDDFTDARGTELAPDLADAILDRLRASQPSVAAGGEVACDEEFEAWLRTACIAKPPPMAYDLARDAYRHAASLASPSSGGWMQAPEDHARKQQQRQIADLILGTSFRVSSPLECSNGFGEDIEHRFQISNGAERFGVVITLTALAAPKSGDKSHE